MVKKVIREEDELEYVCPECGETFTEGASECDSCGMEFDWSEEMEYLCPECGTMVDPEQDLCPGCGAKFTSEAEGELVVEYEPDKEPPTVDELLHAAIEEARRGPPKKSRPRTAKEPAGDEPEEEEEGTASEEEEEPPQQAEEGVGSEVKREALIPGPEVEGPRLYPGGFTVVGLVLLALAILALLFTIMMARYDTWVQGAAEESMGDQQRLFFMAGLVGFAVLMVATVVNLLRTHGATRRE